MSKYHLCPACHGRNTMSQANVEWLTDTPGDDYVYCNTCGYTLKMKKWEVWCAVREIEDERQQKIHP